MENWTKIKKWYLLISLDYFWSIGPIRRRQLTCKNMKTLDSWWVRTNGICSMIVYFPPPLPGRFMPTWLLIYWWHCTTPNATVSGLQTKSLLIVSLKELLRRRSESPLSTSRTITYHAWIRRTIIAQIKYSTFSSWRGTKLRKKLNNTSPRLAISNATSTIQP